MFINKINLSTMNHMGVHQKMKICMIYHHPISILKNDSRVLKEAKSLIQFGYDVTIVYGGNKETEVNEIVFYGLSIPCKAAWSRSKNRLLQRFCILLSYIVSIFARFGINIEQAGLVHISNSLELKADAYHCHDITTILTGYILKKLTGGKLIYDSHELSMESGYVEGISTLSKYILKNMESFIARRSDGVITVNDSIGEIMAKRMNIKKPTIVKNFSNYEQIDIKSNILHETLNLPRDAIIVLYTGGLWKERGLQQLIDTAKLLPEFQFVVIGNIYAEKKDYELNNFHQFGPVAPQEIIKYSSSANVGIHTIQNMSLNYYFSLGNKVGEYIMSGLPIAVSDFPEMRKLAVDEDMGVVFDPENPEGIALALKELLKPETYARKKNNVMEKRKKCCWESEGKKLLDLYKSLVEKS